jgi:hypothetical protein
MRILKKFLQHKAVWMSSTALLLISTVSLFLCSGDARVSADEFKGVWKTTDLNYDDRFFEISDATVTFGTGNGKQDMYYIRAVTKSAGDKDTVYTITYHNIKGTDFKLCFYYRQAHGGVIQFKNQKDIEWTRVNSMQSKELPDINEG